MRALGDIPRRGAERDPERVALIDDTTRLSYGELDAGSEALACALRQRGLARGDRVGLLLRNSCAFMLAYFATLKAGAVVVPINPRLSAKEIQFLRDHTGCAAFVYDQRFDRKIAQLDLPPIRIAVGEGPAADERMGELLGTTESSDLGEPPLESDRAAIFYTSGTTGDPKGVVLTHRNILETVEMLTASFEIDEADTGLCPIPLTHTTVHFTPVPVLAAAGTVVLVDRFQPSRALELLERHRVSLLPTVTAVAVLMAKRALEPSRSYDLSALRKIFLGGANVPDSLIDAWHRIAPNCSAVNCYGMTEMDGPVSRMDRHRFPLRRGSVGKPYPGVEVRILAEGGGEARAGEVGEILVRGGNMMAGYWENPQATSRVLADGWLRSGDLGQLDDDGYLYVSGRRKHILKRGGELIFPDEIENVLLAHPKIKEALVIGVHDEVMGERVAAVIARQPGTGIDVAEVLSCCAEQLADFKVPEYVGLGESELPKNAVGKIDRRAIEAALAAGELELADRRRGSVRSEHAVRADGCSGPSR